VADLEATAADDLFASGSPGSGSGAKSRQLLSGRARPKDRLVGRATAKVEPPDFDSLAAELRALTARRRQTPAERLTTSARSALIERLKNQRVVKAGRWTREELYERGR
jgi:hypothetical protein